MALPKLSRVLFSSAKDDWETPPGLYQRLDEQWGPFTLDAAASPLTAKCKVYFTRAENALGRNWEPHQRVFVNPPYGRGVIGPWVKKAFEESRKGARVVLLLPARTDQGWFHDVVRPHAFHVEFIRGRVRFVGAPSGAPFPSMVVIFEGAR